MSWNFGTNFNYDISQYQYVNNSTKGKSNKGKRKKMQVYGLAVGLPLVTVLLFGCLIICAWKTNFLKQRAEGKSIGVALENCETTKLNRFFWCFPAFPKA